MRVLSCAVAALVLLAGQAQAKPFQPEEIAGRWKAPGGSCDDWVFHALELTYTSKGESALFGIVRTGSDMVRGNIPLDGPDKGKLIWEDTMKPAVKVAPSGGKVKLSALDKASGVQARALEPCPGTAPAFHHYRAMMGELYGPWYEVTKDGGAAGNLVGKESCVAKGSDPDRRGALSFKWGEPFKEGAIRRMVFSRGGVLGGTEWAPLDAQPEPIPGANKSYLKLNIGDGGTARYIEFAYPQGGVVRMQSINPETKRARYYQPCR